MRPPATTTPATTLTSTPPNKQNPPNLVNRSSSARGGPLARVDARQLIGRVPTAIPIAYGPPDDALSHAGRVTS